LERGAIMHKSWKDIWLSFVVIFATISLIGCGGGSTTSYSTSSGTESGTGGVEFSNEYTSPAELGIGDLMYINFDELGDVSVDFSGVSPDAKFILITGSASDSGSGTAMQISSDITQGLEKDFDVIVSNEDVDEKDLDLDASEILSAWLRASEFEIAEREMPPDLNNNSKSLIISKSVSVGDISQFRVLSSLTSTSSYVTVEAEARYVGDEVAVYVDTTVPSSSLDDSDIAELGAFYDEVAVDEQNLIGDLPDINQDGKVVVLLTKQINRLGELGGGIITGYFYGADFYPQSASNQVSNYMEIVYMMVPDPNGLWGYRVSKDFAMSNLLRPVFPHELQHAISYNNHVFINSGSPENNWLNEAMSHFMEDWMWVGVENASRYAIYLASPSSYSLTATGSPNLGERGASYLFLRYMYEQSSDPDGFINRLDNTSLTGVDNLEDAFNGPSGFSSFHEFLARWTVALALTNTGITQDSRYIYRNRVYNDFTGYWQGVCTICDADDNRGTVLHGVTTSEYSNSMNFSVDASAARFFDILDVENVSPVLSLSGSSTGSNFGALIRQE